MSVAALLHLVVFVCASLLIAPRSVPAMPYSVAITLVGSGGQTAASARGMTSSTSALDRLRAQLAEGQASAASGTDRAKPVQTGLAELFGEASPSATPRSAQPAGIGAGAVGTGNASQIDPYAYASLSSPMAQVAATRSLQDQAARCWRRPATARLVKVRVTLNGRGEITGSPKALGSSLDAIDPPQADAAARAVAAVRDCAPFVAPPVQTPTAYDLEFR